MTVIIIRPSLPLDLGTNGFTSPLKLGRGQQIPNRNSNPGRHDGGGQLPPSTTLNISRYNDLSVYYYFTNLDLIRVLTMIPSLNTKAR